MSHLDGEDDPSIHRLEGSSGNQKGGLIIMKKGPSSNSDKHVFKKPSMLGLDKLAAEKRKANEESAAAKKSRVTSYKDDDEEGDDVEEENYSKSGKSHKDR